MRDPKVDGYSVLMALLRENPYLVIDGQVTPETTLDSLEMDSLDKLEFALGLEQEYGLEIPGDVVDKWITVEDVLLCIGKARGE